MKHTPGPWVAHIDYGAGSHPHYVFADEAPSGLKMPAMADNEANARLIAAAPDLLAACKAMDAELRFLAAQGKARQKPHLGIIAQMQAAIAQAEGGGK